MTKPTDTRLELLQHWLENDLKLAITSLEPASADASFRRYFRVQVDQKTFVVMDAPPEKESLTSFIAIGHALAMQAVHTPEIYHENLEQGFLLLEDLGTQTYLDKFRQHSDKAEALTLYELAISALIRCQLGTFEQADFSLPHYSSALLNQEMDLFDHWYLNRHLATTMSSKQKHVWVELKQMLIDNCMSQTQVWVHRDYHSRNLMVTTPNSPGVIDYQDMVIGPIAYDLVSLFKDCYIRWPRPQQLEWLESYRTQAIDKLPTFSVSKQQMVRWYDLVGLQRHLKVLGIFCRLNYRDNKNQYIQDLPLVADYILEVIDLYPELTRFKEAFTAQLLHIK